MRAEIRDLHQKLKTTTVYVTHDQIEAMTMADRIVVMRDGVVEQVRSPLDLYDQPANIFVAGFLGSPAMNFIKAVVGPDGRSASVGGTTLPLPLTLATGREVVLGVRPEYVAIDPAGAQATVQVVEPTGSETHLATELAGQPITAVIKDRYAAHPGDTVGLSFAQERVHAFEPQTGLRITRP